jgi:hypothetical protein
MENLFDKAITNTTGKDEPVDVAAMLKAYKEAVALKLPSVVELDGKLYRVVRGTWDGFVIEPIKEEGA